MKRWKLRVGIVLVFALGVVIGAVGSGLYLKSRVSRFLHAPREVMVSHMMDRLDDELSLSPEQETQIRPLVGQAYDRLAQVRAQALTQVRGIVRDSATQMKTHLTPEQQQRLEASLEHYMRHWHARRH